MYSRQEKTTYVVGIVLYASLAVSPMCIADEDESSKVKLHHIVLNPLCFLK